MVQSALSTLLNLFPITYFNQVFSQKDIIVSMFGRLQDIWPILLFLRTGKRRPRTLNFFEVFAKQHCIRLSLWFHLNDNPQIFLKICQQDDRFSSYPFHFDALTYLYEKHYETYAVFLGRNKWSSVITLQRIIQHKWNEGQVERSLYYQLFKVQWHFWLKTWYLDCSVNDRNTSSQRHNLSFSVNKSLWRNLRNQVWSHNRNPLPSYIDAINF